MNANDGHLSLSWKERSLALELEKDVGGMDTRSTNGEVSVMWASSQGGCDPLKRLLRNVENSPLPPPTHSPSFPPSHSPTFINATSERALQNHNSPFSTSRSPFDFSGSPVPSNDTSTSRPAKRSRSSLTHGSDKSYNGPSSQSMSLDKAKLTNPSREVLSRISQSLNKKSLAKCMASQPLRMQQTQPSRKPSSQRCLSPTHVPPASVPDVGSSNCAGASRRQPKELQSPQRVRKCAAAAPSPSIPISQTERQIPTITNSPRKARIKALLETIDHAGGFSGQAPSSGSSTVPASRQPANAPRRLTSPKVRETDNWRNFPQPRKAPVLGMRRAASVRPPGSDVLPQSQAADMVPEPSRSSDINSMGGTLQSASSNMPPENSGSTSKLRHMTDGETASLPDKQTLTSRDALRRQHKAKGYRSSSPYSATCMPESLSDSDDGLEMVEDNLALVPSKESIAAAEDSPSKRKIRFVGEEDVEANVSSDGASSSSYGDFDIDPAALEDACKAYDP